MIIKSSCILLHINLLIFMGNLGCCPSGQLQQGFKQYCIHHASPFYNKLFSQIVKLPPQSKDYIAGSWEESSIKTGRGIIYSVDCFYYEGDIVDSKANGKGYIIWPTKISYSGQVKDNQANGEGQLYFQAQNMSLKGTWDKGEPNKNSQFQLNSNFQKSLITIIDIISSQDQIDKTTSKVFFMKIQFEDGNVYEGEVRRKNNNNYKIEGKGKLKFVDGSEYNGQFFDGDMHGMGQYRWANGYRFEGEYKKNYRDGVGVYYVDSQHFKKGLWRGGNLQTEFRSE